MTDINYYKYYKKIYLINLKLLIKNLIFTILIKYLFLQVLCL
jgi:hypothetical protein